MNSSIQKKKKINGIFGISCPPSKTNNNNNNNKIWSTIL